MFAAMPETLEELDEAIHSLQTRIDCLTAVDNSVSCFTFGSLLHLTGFITFTAYC